VAVFVDALTGPAGQWAISDTALKLVLVSLTSWSSVNFGSRVCPASCRQDRARAGRAAAHHLRALGAMCPPLPRLAHACRPPRLLRARSPPVAAPGRWTRRPSRSSCRCCDGRCATETQPSRRRPHRYPCAASICCGPPGQFRSGDVPPALLACPCPQVVGSVGSLVADVRDLLPYANTLLNHLKRELLAVVAFHCAHVVPLAAKSC